MKSNRFYQNQNASMDMVNTGIFLVVLLVVLYVGINVIQSVDDAAAIDQPSYATGTLTYSGTVTADETVNISTETYTFTNGTAGEFNVNLGDGTGNATYACTQFVTEVNVNSTLVSASTCSANVTTITALVTGTAPNSYATTENGTNIAFGAATMSGGDAGDTLAGASTSVQTTAEDSYSMANIMPVVMIAVALLSGLLGFLYLFR